MNYITDILRVLSEGLLTEAARPGKIVFNRGTVINADHITLVKQGYKAAQHNRVAPFLLIGIDPMFAIMKTTWVGPGANLAHILGNCAHPEYWGIKATRAHPERSTTNPADDWEDTFTPTRSVDAGRFFRKVLTANLRSIQSIDGITPQEWVAQHPGGSLGLPRPPQQ